MKNIFSVILAALPMIFLTSCATPRPPVAFHNTDNTALVIQSVDGQNSQMLQPKPTSLAQNDQIMTIAKVLPQHQTAVVILENYNEAEIGKQFRDRGTPLFICLRELGYQHIVFVQGNNVPDPNGLITLAEYF